MRSMTLLVGVWALIVAEAAVAEPPWFTDVTEKSGITFRDVNGDPEQLALIDQNGQGIAVFDYDLDGWPDLFFPNGSTLGRLRTGAPLPPWALYRNRGDGTFEDITVHSGLAASGWGTGAAAADYDQDGYPDLYITTYGRNLLYHNNGDGSFSKVGDAGGAPAPGWSSSAAFGDVDGDQLLDLVVGQYVEFDPAHQPATEANGAPCGYRGVRTGCGPWRWHGAGVEFYRNMGGHFERATVAAGFVAVADRRSFQVLLCDLDGNGSLDFYAACDVMPNACLKNDGHGHFQISPNWGGLINGEGQAASSMGLTAGDVDGDGLTELLSTSFANKRNSYYSNRPPPASVRFSDTTTAVGLDLHRTDLGWGTTLSDLDGDGYLDAVLANGHIYPQVDRLRDPFDSYRQPVRCYRGTPEGYFEELVETERTIGKWSARGLAVADLDNDGYLDLVLGIHNGSPRVLRNATGTGARTLMVQLVGTRSSRDPLGARVTLTSGSRRMVRWAIPHQGYQGTQDARLHFGLGKTTPTRLEVRWPSGQLSTITQLRAGALVRIVED